MTNFLHKKKNSNVWYFRRRYPADLAPLIGKPLHIQSLKTQNKHEASVRARAVSVQFDSACADARAKLNAEAQQKEAHEVQRTQEAQEAKQETPESIFNGLPALVREAAFSVIQEQQQNPREWRETVQRWKEFYRAALDGQVPVQAQRTAVQAQAILNGITAALEASPIPDAEVLLDVGTGLSTEGTALGDTGTPSPAIPEGTIKDWEELCSKALALYKERVCKERHRIAELRLSELHPRVLTCDCIQEELTAWCKKRLTQVQPRTVKVQSDSMLSALKEVFPSLHSPKLPQFKGVLHPRNSDRDSMPVQAIARTIAAFKETSKSSRTSGKNSRRSTFDDIAVEALAVLGLRPSELLQAQPNALIQKDDVFGASGVFFRVLSGKNKASQRDIPLSDGVQHVLDLDRLKALLRYQEQNPVPRAVSPLQRRFKEKSGGYTLYQMRHSWKDIAVHKDVDFELRELLLGHTIRGVASVYGSGIPLKQGLQALLRIQETIQRSVDQP